MDSIIGPFHSRATVYLAAAIPFMLLSWIAPTVDSITGLTVSSILMAAAVVLISELLWRIKPKNCYLLSPNGILNIGKTIKTITSFTSISQRTLVLQIALGVGISLFSLLPASTAIEMDTRIFALAVGFDMAISGLWLYTRLLPATRRFKVDSNELILYNNLTKKSKKIQCRNSDITFIPHGLGFYRLYISSSNNYKKSFVLDGKIIVAIHNSLQRLTADDER